MTSLSPAFQQLLIRTKTVCFSHFVMEVPATATLVYGPAAVDWPISYLPGEAGKLQNHVAAKLVEVEKRREYLEKGSAFLNSDSAFGKVINGSIPGQKLAFGSADQATYSIYSFIPIGEDLFIQSANSAISKDAEVEILNSVASNLRLRAEDEIPSEPGTCIDGGFVALKPEFEQVTLGIRLKEFPDVHFSINVVKNQKYLAESSNLETRLLRAEAEGGSWYSRIKFFRRGPRQLGDWKGFEALALKPAQANEMEAHGFHFISLGEPNASLRPRLDLQLDTGASGHRTGAVRPSLSNEEAVALWDKLTASIRVRPSGGKKSGSDETPRGPLPGMASTGDLCPQTGWWQCLKGGQRLHVTQGEFMPFAVLNDKASLWQKLTGNQATQTRASIWKLDD